MKRFFISLFVLFSFFVADAQNEIDHLHEALLNETPIIENLQELCDQYGGRVTGSLLNEASVDWAVKKFEEAGVSVSKQAFQMPVMWAEKSVQCKIENKTYSNFKAAIVSKYMTKPGSYRGQLVHVGIGDASAFEKNKAAIENNFVLVSSDLCLDIDGLFAEYAHSAKIEALAAEYKAQGIVFMSSRGRGLLYRFITSKTVDAEMPHFVMSREDAGRCARLLDEGLPLTFNAEVDANISGEFTSHNVIGEIKGSTLPDEIILIGAHLDSWALGTGANDNGCNVSMMIDIARQMTKLSIQPKRTIRFALWNGEEQGYFGSHAYTLDHADELDNHKMITSIDIGSGEITGFFTNGRNEVKEQIDVIVASHPALDSLVQLDIPIVGTDNFDFMLQGVPNLVGIHKPQVYGLNYHASSDTFDKVDQSMLKRNAAVVGVLALMLANAEGNPKLHRQSRAEIQKIFDDNKLEFTMQMFNVWDTWMDGSRGRSH